MDRVDHIKTRAANAAAKHRVIRDAISRMMIAVEAYSRYMRHELPHDDAGQRWRQSFLVEILASVAATWAQDALRDDALARETLQKLAALLVDFSAVPVRDRVTERVHITQVVGSIHVDSEGIEP
jgi:hypothetical protein